MYKSSAFSDQIIQAKTDLVQLGYDIGESSNYSSTWTSSFDQALWAFMAEDGLTQRYYGSANSTDLLFLWLTIKATKQIKTIPWGNITINISPKNPVPGDEITITAECDNAYSIEANVTNPDGESYGLIKSVTDSNQNGKIDLTYKFTAETNKIYLLDVVADNMFDSSSDEYKN